MEVAARDDLLPGKGQSLVNLLVSRGGQTPNLFLVLVFGGTGSRIEILIRPSPS